MIRWKFEKAKIAVDSINGDRQIFCYDPIG